MLRLLKDRWFLVGIGAGVLAVGPKVLLQFGVVIGNQGETPFAYPGLIAYIAMIVGVWCFNGALVYPSIAVGVLANGLAYAWVGRLVRVVRSRRVSRDAASSTRRHTGESEPKP
jgi:hypothetical protein